jgi:RNA polymerase sigma factor (sigma-70 family)
VPRTPVTWPEQVVAYLSFIRMLVGRSRVPRNDAEDVVQSTALRALEANYLPNRSVRAFLETLTQREIVDYWRAIYGRKQNRQPIEPMSPECLPDIADGESSEDAIGRIWTEQAICSLSDPRSRQIAWLYFGQRWTLGEVGQALSVTESRVCQLMVAIRRDLRRAVGQ